MFFKISEAFVILHNIVVNVKFWKITNKVKDFYYAHGVSGIIGINTEVGANIWDYNSMCGFAAQNISLQRTKDSVENTLVQ